MDFLGYQHIFHILNRVINRLINKEWSELNSQRHPLEELKYEETAFSPMGQLKFSTVRTECGKIFLDYCEPFGEVV